MVIFFFYRKRRHTIGNWHAACLSLRVDTCQRGHMKHPEWEKAHDVLKVSLQKEVHMMREILANMHEEEVSLLLNDKGSWNQIMQNRFNLIERLSDLRLQRIQATQTIETIAQSIHQTTDSLTLEQILPTDEVVTCEILSLRDQVLALIERMNKQLSRNDYLYYHVEHWQHHPGTQPHAAPMKEERAKRKAAVATYQIKRLY
jgi:hypothetical protein